MRHSRRQGLRAPAGQAETNAMEEDEDDARHGNRDKNADDADLEGNNTTAFRVHNTGTREEFVFFASFARVERRVETALPRK